MESCGIIRSSIETVPESQQQRYNQDCVSVGVGGEMYSFRYYKQKSAAHLNSERQRGRKKKAIIKTFLKFE